MEGFLCYFNAAGATQEIPLPRNSDFLFPDTAAAAPAADPVRLSWNAAQATWLLKGRADGRVILDGSPQVVFSTDEEGRVLTDPTGAPRPEALTTPLENLTEIRLLTPGSNTPAGPWYFFKKPAAPEVAGTPHEVLPLAQGRVIIGRKNPQTAPPLPGGETVRWDLDPEDRGISREHLRLEYENGAYWLVAVSESSSRLNGRGFAREKLLFGDRFSVRDYHFEFTGQALRRVFPGVGGNVFGRALTVQVMVKGQPLTILKEITLDVKSGEFIGILGGSGQGKSTLLNAICGVNPATAGEVMINGVKLEDREQLRALSIGFVPQDDIVHRELTVTEAITFSARLRLKQPRHAIRELVDGIIERLGLAPHRHKRVSMLSGGQRKRVSIATELLTKPSVLFLDEPSSGLDPATEAKLMDLLQSLSLTGITVICTTHVLQRAHLFDRICFIQGGRLVFMGTPDEARSHFVNAPGDDGRSSGAYVRASQAGSGEGFEDGSQVQEAPLEKIYGMLDEGKDAGGREVTAEEWEQRFLVTEPARVARTRVPVPNSILTTQSTVPRTQVGYLSTLLILLQRQWKVLRADRLPRAFLRLPTNLVFLLAQALAIGVMVGWVSDDPGFRMFLCVVATLWFGTSNGAQQIVSELPVFRRERVSGQGINVYIQSKFAFLTAITATQAMLLFFTVIVSAAIFHPPDRGMAISKQVEKTDASGRPVMENGAPVKERKIVYEKEDNFRARLEQRIEADQPPPPAAPPSAAPAPPGEDVVIADGTEQQLTEEEKKLFESAGEIRPREPATTAAADTPAAPRADTPPPAPDVIPPPPSSGLFSRGVLTGLARYLSMEDNILTSGAKPLLDPEDNDAPLYNADGSKRLQQGLPLTQVVLTSIGLRVLALLLTAVVGVSMGLAISALVQSETQAVMWVPLMLIPQILFGGFVVTLPEMSRSVRGFSPFMPSNAAEKVMEVAQIYGQQTPYLSNSTKIPVFLTPDAAQEEVNWWVPRRDDDGRRVNVNAAEIKEIDVPPNPNIPPQDHPKGKKRRTLMLDGEEIVLSEYELEDGKKVNSQEWNRVSPDVLRPGSDVLEDPATQKFDKTSDYNTAWQNLAVHHAQVGTHSVIKEKGKKKDMVSVRNDVKYPRFTIYTALGPAFNAIAVLAGWFAACYVIVFLGLRSRQSGK
ncbi:MAG: hypothetical protein JWL81_428 [Verrucomicrobiales bacterium]|nr:hypothetical protein [Verrucomicrobiales bacterium]